MANNLDINGLNDFITNYYLLAGQLHQQIQQMHPALAQSLHANVQQHLNVNYQPQQQVPLSVQQQYKDLQYSSRHPDNATLLMAQQMNKQQVPPFQYQPEMIQTPSKVGSFDLKSNDGLFNSQAFNTPQKDDNTKSLRELQAIALHGCERATVVFNDHSKRPYFKKIDLLSDRLKQDLSVTNKAVININSHGISWAIKDFIFVFNRIINAWTILRDYFYSNSEGMQCVKDSIDPKFAQEFVAWQEATKSLIATLIQSFENLHERDRRNGNRKNMKEPESNKKRSSNVEPSFDPFKTLFDPLIANNSEHAQLSGGYLKSAVYKPVTSSSDGSSSQPTTPGSSNDSADFDALKIMIDQMDNSSVVERNGKPPLYKRCSVEKINSGSGHKNQHRCKKSLTESLGDMKMEQSGDLDGIEQFPELAQPFKF